MHMYTLHTYSFSLMERCWEEDPKKRPFFYEIVKELTSLQRQPVLRTEIKRIDEALKRGSIELVGSPVIPTPLAPDQAVAGPESSCTSSQPSSCVLSRDGSPRQASTANAKRGEISLRESLTGARGSPNCSRGSESPIQLQMNPALDATSPFEGVGTLTSPEASSDEESDGYENSHLGVSLRRHSIDVPPRPREDVSAYYNLPKGYFTLLRGKQKSRSSSDLRKIGDSQLSIYQYSSIPSGGSETVKRKPPKIFPKPPKLPPKLFPRPTKPPPKLFPRPTKPPPRRKLVQQSVNLRHTLLQAKGRE